MASSFFDSVHELKTKFPVIEETLVFMYKFIFPAFSHDKEIFSLLLDMFTFRSFLARLTKRGQSSLLDRLDYQPLFGNWASTISLYRIQYLLPSMVNLFDLYDWK